MINEINYDTFDIKIIIYLIQMHLIILNKWRYIYDFFIFNYRISDIKKDLLRNYNVGFILLLIN